MDWTSPEVLPVASALAGVLLTGTIALIADNLNGRREERRRKADLAERLFEQKRDAYLAFYRWALRYRASIDDRDAALAQLAKASPSDHGSLLDKQGLKESLAEYERAALTLDDEAGAEVLRSRDADVRFFGTEEVADAARELMIATVRWATVKTNHHLRALTEPEGAQPDAVNSDDSKTFEDDLEARERAFLTAVKKDLGVAL